MAGRRAAVVPTGAARGGRGGGPDQRHRWPPKSQCAGWRHGAGNALKRRCEPSGPVPPGPGAGPGQSPRCCRPRWPQKSRCRPAQQGCCAPSALGWLPVFGSAVRSTTGAGRYSSVARWPCWPRLKPAPTARKPRPCAATAPSGTATGWGRWPPRSAACRCSGQSSRGLAGCGFPSFAPHRRRWESAAPPNLARGRRARR